jgi:hypothetical protein
MGSDGYSNSPLTASAVAYDTGSGSCTTGSYLGKITEILDSANWYDGVIALAITNNEIALTSPTSPQTLVVYAVPSVGSAFVVPTYGDLTFTAAAGASGKFTVGANTGILTWVAGGASEVEVEVKITAVPAITAVATVTTS